MIRCCWCDAEATHVLVTTWPAGKHEMARRSVHRDAACLAHAVKYAQDAYLAVGERALIVSAECERLPYTGPTLASCGIPDRADPGFDFGPEGVTP